MSYTASDIKKLREETGAGMMDCKKALDEANGDYQKAMDLVRARGLAKAEKKADRETGIGYLTSYVHSNNQIGCLLEIKCETDFVARNPEFQEMAKSVAMQIVAMGPEDVEELLQQDNIKNPSETVDQMIKAVSGKIGEKFVVSRFTRYMVGE